MIVNWRLALACALPLAIALFVGASVVNVPMYDEWIWAPLVLALHDHTLHAADLWAPQGAHRSFVPTAIAVGLAQLDGWDVRLEAMLGVALTGLAQFALWRLLRRRFDRSRAAGPFLAASLVLYALTQSENWLWGFQLSWFLVNACALAAVALLDGAERPGLRLLAAIAAAAIASFSLIFGFAVWIAGAVVLFADRAWLRASAWCAAALVAGGAFLHGYAPPRFENGWIAGAKAPLLDGAQFVLAYLGAPLGIAGGRWLSEALGAALLVAVGVILATGGPRRNAAPWIALLAFTLAAAALEAIGRGGNGPDAALAFRYSTPSSLGWIALVRLIATYRPQVRLALRRGLIATGALLFASANAAGAFEALQLVGAQHAALAALRDPAAHDDEELALYVNDPAMLRREAAALRAAQLGPYRDPGFTRPARSDRTTTPSPPGSAR